MHKIIKGASALAIVGAAVFAVPAVADAADYPPTGTVVTGDVTVSGPTVPGGTVTVHFDAGVFFGLHQLSVYERSTGSVGSIAPAVFKAADAGPINSVSSLADGSATLTSTIPADATAPIVVTATDGTHTAEATVPVTLAAGASVTGSTGSAAGLPSTGTYIAGATVWGAVGLMALGAGFILVRRLSRRTTRSSAHRG